MLRKRLERVKGIEPSFLEEQAKSSKTGAKTLDPSWVIGKTLWPVDRNLWSNGRSLKNPIGKKASPCFL